MCIEKFIDGLEEPFCSHVDILQPSTLSQAYQMAIEKANKIARRAGEFDFNKANNKSLPPSGSKSNLPFVLRHQNNYRAPQQQFNQPPYHSPTQNFAPHINSSQPPRYANKPPHSASQQFRQNIPAQRPNFNNYSKVEPMEVDRSIRSNKANYINRPNYNLQATNYKPKASWRNYNNNQTANWHECTNSYFDPDYCLSENQEEIDLGNYVEPAMEQQAEDNLNFQWAIETKKKP